MKYLNANKIILLITVSMMSMGVECDLTKNAPDDTPYTPPPDPDTYIAETPEQGDYYIGLDADGYQMWGDDWVYGVSTKLVYRITFPRIGGKATMAEEYRPFRVININNEQNYTQTELSTMMNRTDFPVTVNTIEPTNMIFVKPTNEYGYFKWTEGGNEYRGNVIIGEEDDYGSIVETTFYIEFKTPTASFNQTYIIVNPAYPQWGGMSNLPNL